jgi:hypothetical protein
MPMTGFFCQDEYLAKTAKLTDEEVGRLFRALIDYHANGVLAELDGRESIAFDFIKEDIDKAEEAYAKKCEQASKNRRKALSNDTTDDDGGQRALTDVNGGDQYNINKKNINKKNNNSSSKNIVTLKRFIPPTVEQIKAYCDERGVYLIDPEQFIDYYEARGWMLNKNRKMVDWKAAVRTWEKNERDRHKEKTADDLPF